MHLERFSFIFSSPGTLTLLVKPFRLYLYPFPWLTFYSLFQSSSHPQKDVFHPSEPECLRQVRSHSEVRGGEGITAFDSTPLFSPLAPVLWLALHASACSIYTSACTFVCIYVCAHLYAHTQTPHTHICHGSWQYGVCMCFVYACPFRPPQ